MWNNSMSLFGSLAGDCSILQRRLQKQNSTQQPFRGGNLSGEAASAGEFLCENLKNIHANLNHLTWRSKTGGKG